MKNNEKNILNYLYNEYQNRISLGMNPDDYDTKIFEEKDIQQATNLNDEHYNSAIENLKFLNYITKTISGIKLEVD